MKRYTLILLMLISPLFTFGQSPFMGDLKPGEFTVGFKTMTVLDSTRFYNGQPRPLQISLWYPASGKNKKSVNFKDYLFTDATKLKLQNLSEEEQQQVQQQFISSMEKRGASAADLRKLLQTSTSAFHGLPLSKGSYPLILSLQGGGRPASTQFILNEYLASHGYLVASFSDIFASLDRKANTAIQNMEALGLDIALTISILKSQRDISFSAIGTIAFSRAGEAAIFHHTHQGNLDAMIALDAQPSSGLMETLAKEKLNAIELPMLTFFSNHQKKMSDQEALADRESFDFLPKSSKLKIRMMELNHGDQTSAGMIAAHLVQNFNRWPLIGNAKLGYETICRLSLNFFDLHLKGLEAGQAITDAPSERLNLPEGFIVVHRIKKR